MNPLRQILQNCPSIRNIIRVGKKIHEGDCVITEHQRCICQFPALCIYPGEFWSFTNNPVFRIQFPHAIQQARYQARLRLKRPASMQEQEQVNPDSLSTHGPSH